MSPLKATVEITGLAYCHFLSGSPELQALFLHPDGRHELRLQIIKTRMDDTKIIGEPIPIEPGNEIRLRTTRARSIPPPAGSSLDPIVNIDLLHDLGRPLSFLPRDGESRPLSFLSIPDAQAYASSDGITGTAYEFWRIYRKNNKALEKHDNVGAVLAMDYEIDGPANPGKIELTFTKMARVDIPYENLKSIRIILDNDCPNTLCASDFRYYYELVDGGETEFEILPPFPPPREGKPSDKEAACNPGIGDPPCTPEELFNGTCH